MTDKDRAFININYIFNSREHEEKSNSWKLDELRKVLSRMQEDMYLLGVKNGFEKAIKILEKEKP